MKQFYTMKFKNGLYLHTNHDYKLGQTRKFRTTDNLDEAKLWQKEGMMLTFFENNKDWVDAVDPWWVVKTVCVVREED